MAKRSETLASIAYTRNEDDAITKATPKGSPAKRNRPTPTTKTTASPKAPARPTTNTTQRTIRPASPKDTYNYNKADELEKTSTANYIYDEVGQRTKVTPTSGPATTYAYDQASNLTAIERPEEGATPRIEDSYSYNGEALRTSETIYGTTSYLDWDTSEELPVLLAAGASSYLYGPGGYGFEQISSAGVPTYLHHDAGGSIRLLTGSSGTVTGATSFEAYGNVIEHTGSSTTALGFDGQYMTPDVGMIYLRAREYAPGTADFLSVDPLVATTRTPYGYAADNPVNSEDPTGLMIDGRTTPEVAPPTPTRSHKESQAQHERELRELECLNRQVEREDEEERKEISREVHEGLGNFFQDSAEKAFAVVAGCAASGATVTAVAGPYAGVAACAIGGVGAAELPVNPEIRRKGHHRYDD